MKTLIFLFFMFESVLIIFFSFYQKPNNEWNGKIQSKIKGFKEPSYKIQHQNENRSNKTCGYRSCPIPDPEALNVHIVPHSHDDVGWMKTLDEYYYGLSNVSRKGGVQYIIDSVIIALKQNPKRRFIYVETAFFWKWWQEQDESTKQQMQDLINNGQIEIVGGGWCMNDETVAHYQSIIDQFTLGLTIINDSLGECGRPKIGWQVDPYGHSKEMASIFNKLGYDAVFFGRVDYRDMTERLNSQTAEMLWQSDVNFENNSALFTSLLYNLYHAPHGFCFDIMCSDEPIVDNVKSEYYNLENKVKKFANFLSKQATFYKTNNIIVTMGGDFHYQDALRYFKNLDKLINGFTIYSQNDTSGRPINVFYSTPSCYVKAVNEYAQNNLVDFPIKTDDFLPYASDPYYYWSGGFISRPTFKRFERQAGTILQIGKQLLTFAGAKYSDNIENLKQVSAIMQHHDSVTGLEKQRIAQSYAKMLTDAVENVHKDINPIMLQLLKKTDSNDPLGLNLSTCLLANVSHCPSTETKRFIVSVYNPLSHSISHYVRVPVNHQQFTIIGPKNESVEYQVTPRIKNFDYMKNVTVSRFDLVFLAKNISPLGIKLYHVTSDDFGKTVSDIQPNTSINWNRLGNKHLQVTINPYTGKMSLIKTYNVKEMRLSPDFFYYIAAKGDNKAPERRASESHLFRPSPTYPNAILVADVVNVKVYKGPLIDEAHQVFNDWLKLVVRIYKSLNRLELDWAVGPINISDGEGKEVVLRIGTDLINCSHFYTDSNGRQLQIRRNNFRLTYNFTNEEPVASNQYPVTNKIVLKNSTIQVTVVTDRAQAGASLNLADIDLIIHRRLFPVINNATSEPLDEIEFGKGLVVRGQHIVAIHKVENDFVDHVSEQTLLSPWVFVADATSSSTALEKLQNSMHFEFSGFSRQLPKNIHILTLEPWNSNQVLLRLENTYTKPENPYPMTVSLKGLFTVFDIVSLHETTLGGNQWLEENETFKWIGGKKLEDFMSNIKDVKHHVYNNKRKHNIAAENREIEIILRPMEIRTFIADVKFR